MKGVTTMLDYRNAVIVRNGMEIKLADDEIANAAKVMRFNFYLDELSSEYGDEIPETDMEQVAENANKLYSEAYGSEYACLEEAIRKYNISRRIKK